MTEDRNQKEPIQSDESLPPPIFDANASASAQPVEPIRRSAVSRWRDRLRSLSGGITGQSRMLAAVILIGLITGALAGVLLVNTARSKPASDLEVHANEPVSEIPATEKQKLDAFADELATGTVQTVSPAGTRDRRPRARVRSHRPRAYRVAILR
jgi:hypothetical protein